MRRQLSIMEPEASHDRCVLPRRTGQRTSHKVRQVSRRTAVVKKPVPILVVEDDFLVGTEAEATLSEAGFEVVGVATTTEEAIDLVESRRPSIVVMDIRLAGKRDGVDAALEIFQNYGIRCLFATAHHDEHIRSRAKPAEPLGWLEKPYSMPSLVEAVRSALSDLGHTKR
jgi:DNA-binding NarL/FixJ family response regulator